MQSSTNESRGKCEPEQSSGKAQQQTFKDRFTNDDCGTSAESKAKRVFAATTNGPDQKQAGDIDAGNQQHDGDGQEQSAEQRPDLRDGILTQRRDVTADVDRGHAGREIAHDLSGDTVRVLRGLRHGRCRP